MRKINKKNANEPKELINYRKQVDAIYDGPNFTPVKEKIKEALLKEQGWVCAYCMKRISLESMKVEHFIPQSEDASLDLKYSNMLGCCLGGEGQKPIHQTCDTRKGNSILSISPSDKKFKNETIKYNRLGTISSSNSSFDEQINTILNLNYSRLKRNRSSALEGFKSQLSKNPKRANKNQLNLLSSKIIKKDDKFKEYYGIILHYIENRTKDN